MSEDSQRSEFRPGFDPFEDGAFRNEASHDQDFEDDEEERNVLEKMKEQMKSNQRIENPKTESLVIDDETKRGLNKILQYLQNRKYLFLTFKSDAELKKILKAFQNLKQQPSGLQIIELSGEKVDLENEIIITFSPDLLDDDSLEEVRQIFSHKKNDDNRELFVGRMVFLATALLKYADQFRKYPSIYDDLISKREKMKQMLIDWVQKRQDPSDVLDELKYENKEHDITLIAEDVGELTQIATSKMLPISTFLTSMSRLFIQNRYKVLQLSLEETNSQSEEVHALIQENIRVTADANFEAVNINNRYFAARGSKIKLNAV